MKFIPGLLAAWLISFSSMQAQESGVSVELTLAQDNFLPNEEMQIGVRIVNYSGQTLTFGQDNSWLTFSVEGRRNFIISKLDEVPVAGEFSLESSLAGTKRVNLTPYFNFKQPGRYQVTATVRIPQWKKEITSKPKTFDVIEGTKLKEIEFGRPLAAGETNALPETRKYILQQATYGKQIKLYVRLTDVTGSKTYKVFPIAAMVSFSRPEAQLDKYSNLHVLNQIGAKSFNYSVINPEGQILTRQTYEYSSSRPILRPDEEGKIHVAGGVRRAMTTDLPPENGGAKSEATNRNSESPESAKQK